MSLPAGLDGHERTPPPEERPVSGVLAIVCVLAAAILVADWLTPAGVVIGMLLGVPIILSSIYGDRRQVLIVSGVCLAGFLVAAVYGRGPISPQAVWLPNRIFALVAIAGSAFLALVLQRRREVAEQARREAEASREITRILHTLMAHDLRSPLTLAHQGITFVRSSMEENRPIDASLVGELDARLRRSLRAVDLVLESARLELLDAGASHEETTSNRAVEEMREDLGAFATEALVRGKELVVQIAPVAERARVNAMVLRQAVALLVDNSIRHAREGPVHVAVEMEGRGRLVVEIRDAGPARNGASDDWRDMGAGMGLKLGALLAARAGGSLELVRADESGTAFRVTLPTVREPE